MDKYQAILATVGPETKKELKECLEIMRNHPDPRVRAKAKE